MEAPEYTILSAGADEAFLRDAVAGASVAVSVQAVGTVEAAIEHLAGGRIDCLVCEADLPDGTAEELLGAGRGDAVPSLVFCRDQSRLDEVLSAGADDVVRRRSGVDSASLAGRRLEGLLASAYPDRMRGAPTGDTDSTDWDRTRAATAEVLGALYEVTTDRDSTFEEKIAQLLERGCEYLELPVGYLTRLEIDDEHTPSGTQTVVQSHGDHELLEPGETCPLSEAYCHKTIQTDGLLAVEDATGAGMADGPAHERFGLDCYIGGNVLVDGQLYGTLCFASTTPHDGGFSELDRTVVRMMAEWVSYELERREARNELELAETVFKQAQDGIFVVDVDDGTFRIERVNPAYGELTGMDVDEMRGKTPVEVVGEEFGAEVERRYRECLTRREPIEYEERLPFDDEVMTWQTKLAPVVEDGTVVRLVGVTRDVTENRQRQRQLAELRQGIDTLTEQVPMVLFAYDAEGVFTRLEGSGLETLGLQPGEAVGESIFELFGDHDTITDHARRSIDGEAVHGTVEIDGRIFEVWHKPVLEASDDTGRVVGFALDVTERTERKRELERKTRAMEKAPVGITLTDPDRPDNPLSYVNEEFTAVTGYTLEEAVGRNCRFLQGADTDPEPVASLRAAIDEQRPVTAELRNYRADGTEFWNELTIAPIEDGTGDITNYVGFQRDVTERTERERALALRNRAIEAAPIGITIHDATGPTRPIVYANGGFESLTGYDPDTLEGADISLLRTEETDDDQFRTVRTALDRGESASQVLLLARRDGTPFWGRVVIAPVCDERDELTHFVGFLQDVTDTKEHAEEIQRRLDEFGDVLADELQTPVRRARESVKAARAHDDTDDIKAAEQSLDRVDKLIDDLRTVHSFAVTSREVLDATGENGDET